MENLKTDGYYNEDDFVQEDRGLRELTVEISLCEYRNLVRELTKCELYIEKLEIEKEDFKKRIEDLQKCLATIKMPEWVDAIRRILAGSNNDMTEDDEKSKESVDGEETEDGKKQ